MGTKDKICIILMGIMFLQVLYIIKNDKKKVEYVEVMQKGEVSDMYETLARYEGIKVLEIKNNLNETIGEVEITGHKDNIINKINSIEQYKIIDYDISFSEELLKVNIEIK
ncbi:MAG: hypothetical protein ACRC28_14205 [Clostridium sp.]|uniref:hypothetical protein n=1 Tax=Clostridium sp. TaxID=1506 RepID=UPI003F30884D